MQSETSSDVERSKIIHWACRHAKGSTGLGLTTIAVWCQTPGCPEYRRVLAISESHKPQPRKGYTRFVTELPDALYEELMDQHIRWEKPVSEIIREGLKGLGYKNAD